MYRVKKRIKQSEILAVSENLQAIDAAFVSILRHRIALETYIGAHADFEWALDPVAVDSDAPRIVRLAAGVAELAEVGPMAAIPGSLADLAVEAMLQLRSKTNLIENGGEIAATSTSKLTVGIYAGECTLSGRVGFLLSPLDFPIGIATSSATVSHALSFGEADAAVVVADTASMADAVATAVCNAVQGDDHEASIQRGLEAAESVRQVRGALIVRGNYLGVFGKLPQLVRINENIESNLEVGLPDVVKPGKTIL